MDSLTGGRKKNKLNIQRKEKKSLSGTPKDQKKNALEYSGGKAPGG